MDLSNYLTFKGLTLQTIKTNVIGTLNMLGLAKRVGARSAIFSFLFLNILLIIKLLVSVGFTKS
jgi:hypothetical protein